MPTNNKDIKDRYLKSWNNMIAGKKEAFRLSDTEFSALSSWILDCFGSFDRIYYDLLKKIDSTNPHNNDLLHEVVSEIYFDLKHIQEHIEDAENGFLELMRILAGEEDRSE